MHGEKIVDGIPIKYLCQPCPECKAKLEAAEEMARVMKTISDLPETIIGKSVKEYAINAYAAWEKTGKGEG